MCCRMEKLLFYINMAAKVHLDVCRPLGGNKVKQISKFKV